MISDISINKKPYNVKSPIGRIVKRDCWDVEYLKDDKVCHALFSTREAAEQYAANRLGYRR